MTDSLAIGVMTSPNLKERYTACKNTWVKDFNNVFLLGGEFASQADPSLVSIKGAGEDYSQPCGLWTDQPYVREIQSESESNGLIWRSVSGGAGFFLSRSLMKKCYSIIDEFNDHWLKISGATWHGDIAISYMLKKYFDINCTHLIYLLSQPPSHFEDPSNHHWYAHYPISILEVIKSPMVFHYIKPNEMFDIYEKYSKQSLIKKPYLI